MPDDYLIDLTGEPLIPEKPEDDRPDAEVIECRCGTRWSPEWLDSCPSCGREESEAHLSDEEMEE